jgi:hypothetical protein
MDNTTGNVTADNTSSTTRNANTHWDKPLGRSIISGPNGNGSSSRTGVLMIVAASIAWVSYYLVVHKALPDFTSLTAETLTTLKSKPDGL